MVRFFAFFLINLCSLAAFAQIPSLENPIYKPFSEQDQGWKTSLTLSAFGEWRVAQNVPSTTDGDYYNLGGSADAQARLYGYQHIWENELTINESFKKTPTSDNLLKAHDLFQVTTEFDYYFIPVAGVYVGGALDAPIFSGTDYRSKTLTYNITYLDNTTTQITANSLALTSVFTPLDLKQYAGVFYKPFSETGFNWKLQLGVLAHELIMQGQLKVTGSNSTNVYVKELSNGYNFGPMAATYIKGSLWEDKVTYRADFLTYYAAVLYPGTTNATFDDRFNYEANFNVVAEIIKPVSFEWLAKVRKRPNISPNVQFLNEMLLSIRYTF